MSCFQYFSTYLFCFLIDSQCFSIIHLREHSSCHTHPSSSAIYLSFTDITGFSPYFCLFYLLAFLILISTSFCQVQTFFYYWFLLVIILPYITNIRHTASCMSPILIKLNIFIKDLFLGSDFPLLRICSCPNLMYTGLSKVSLSSFIVVTPNLP